MSEEIPAKLEQSPDPEGYDGGVQEQKDRLELAGGEREARNERLGIAEYTQDGPAPQIPVRSGHGPQNELGTLEETEDRPDGSDDVWADSQTEPTTSEQLGAQQREVEAGYKEQQNS